MRKYYLNSFLILAMVVFSLFFIVPKAQAEDFNFSGYAWSSNIGWIDMSGVKYQIENQYVQSANYPGYPSSPGWGSSPLNGYYGNALLSGYAWSPNVGWISFEENSGCYQSSFIFPPNSSCHPRIDLINQDNLAINNRLFGYAKILSYSNDGEQPANSNWADGWISLGVIKTSDGTLDIQNHVKCLANNSGIHTDQYPPLPTVGDCSGYAWGGNVTGWIDFSNVKVQTLPQPTVSLKANQVDSIFINPGESFTLTWDGVNLCSGSCAKIVRTKTSGISGGNTIYNYELQNAINGSLLINNLGIGNYAFSINAFSIYGDNRVGGQASDVVYVSVGDNFVLEADCSVLDNYGKGKLKINGNSALVGKPNGHPSTNSFWPYIPSLPNTSPFLPNGSYSVNAGNPAIIRQATLNCSPVFPPGGGGEAKTPSYREN